MVFWCVEEFWSPKDFASCCLVIQSCDKYCVLRRYVCAKSIGIVSNLVRKVEDTFINLSDSVFFFRAQRIGHEPGAQQPQIFSKMSWITC